MVTNTLNRQRGALIDVDPRVESLATSNNPPMEREGIEISAELVRVRALIKALGRKHAAQRTNLELYAAKLTSVIHPMRLLPPEILSEIFSYLTALDPHTTCQNVKDNGFVNSLDTKSGVWALTHVCTRWREIVTTTSSLWTTVGLQFDKYPKSSATADILATYLARSKQHKLDVIVYSEDDISRQPATELLMKTCQRWQGGWFCLPADTFLAWDAPFNFEHLAKLRVCIQPPPELPLAVLTDDSTARCRAFKTAPAVKDVAVDNHFLFTELFDFDWSTVHLFCQEQCLSDELAECYPVADLLSSLTILSNASALEIAQFDLHAFDTEFETMWLDGVQDYILHHGGSLRNAAIPFLVLKGSPGSWQRILSKVELPNLQTLHYHPNAINERFPDPLSAETGSSLRKLTVHVVDHNDTDDIIAFMEMTPNLVELTMLFELSFDIGPMFTRVFRMTSDLRLVPRLETLIVRTLGRTRVIITKEFVTALKRRADGRVLSKTALEIKLMPSEILVVNNDVQLELDSLLLGPDPFLNSSFQSVA